MPDLQQAVDAALDWPAEHVAAAVVGADGAVLARAGEQDRTFPLASVTKLLAAYAVLIAVEEGAVEWDTPAGPDGSTVRHLIAHTSGLAFDSDRVQGAPGTKRIYSNAGFEQLGQAVAEAAGMPFEYYLRDAVLRSAGDGRDHAARLPGRRRHLHRRRPGPVRRRAAGPDAARPEHAWPRPPRSPSPAWTGCCPASAGSAPTTGGWASRSATASRRTGPGRHSSPRTFGHFGQSGTFLWVDPDAGAAAVALTDRDFGEWSKQAWPPWTDGVLAALR